MDRNMSDDYTAHLSRETYDIVGNFLVRLGACREADNDRLCSVVGEFIAELQKCLTRCRSLPPSAKSCVLEVTIQYNLLFAGFLKARSSQSVHRQTQVLSTHCHTLLWSLQRVQQAVGIDVWQTAGDGDLHPGTDHVQRVGQVLSVLLPALPITCYQELRESVSLLACLWALLTLLEKGPSSPLPWLSPLTECAVFDDVLEMNFGFLVGHPTPVRQWVEVNGNSKPAPKGTINNFAHYLLATSFFHRQQWQHCKDCLSKVDGSPWTPLGDLLKAHAMLGEGDSVGAIKDLLCAVKRPALGPAVLCELNKALAACYTAQGLPTLALDHLSHCQRLRPQSAAIVLLLADHARLAMHDADLEVTCLTSLVQVTEKCEGKPRGLSESLLNELLVEAAVCEHRPTLSQALYRLASRCADLNRNREAAQAYLKLIRVYQPRAQQTPPPGPRPPAPVQLPGLLTVCRAAAQQLLMSGDHRQCGQLCDKALDAVCSSTLFCAPDLHCSLSQPSWQAGADDSLAMPQSQTSARQEDQWPLGSGRKRRRSCMEGGEECEGEDGRQAEVEGGWAEEKDRTLLVLCKAECLVVQGDYSGAAQLLHRAVQHLEECYQWAAHPKSESSSATAEPAGKRPRYASGHQNHEDADNHLQVWEEQQEEEEEKSSWHDLSHQVCITLSDTLRRWAQPLQALRAARLAAQVKPDDEVSQYYLISTLGEVGRRREGYQTWLRLRGLPHNTGTVLLQSALQDLQNKISTMESDRKDRRLGVVTDRHKMELDLACLKTLAESRSKK